jgi:hypothetical protein
MFKGQLFQLLDKDSDQIGLIWTENETIKENRVEDLWQEFYNSFDGDADDFVGWINVKLSTDTPYRKEEFPNGILFERVFVSDCNI